MIGTPVYPTVPHPQPSFYETTVAEIGMDRITHIDVEKILARPKWDYQQANREAMKKINAGRVKPKRAPRKPKKKS